MIRPDITAGLPRKELTQLYVLETLRGDAHCLEGGANGTDPAEAPSTDLGLPSPRPQTSSTWGWTSCTCMTPLDLRRWVLFILLRTAAAAMCTGLCERVVTVQLEGWRWSTVQQRWVQRPPSDQECPWQEFQVNLQGI